MIIRNSEIQDFLRCRLRWHYRWVRQLESKKKSSKLVLGTLFHKFLEEYYGEWNNDEPDYKLVYGLMMMKSMYNEEVMAKVQQDVYDPQEASDMWALLEGLAHAYHEYWSKKQVKTWKVIATEQTYYINMRTLAWTTDRAEAEFKVGNDSDSDVWYECTLDLVIEVDGQIWICDHKTVSKLEDFVKKTEMDRQISRYCFAANVIFNGQLIQGLIYNLIKKELPKQPEALKKGGLSVAKNQRTTYDMYVKALEEKGLNPEEYAEMLQLLQDREHVNGNDWMQRVPVKRNAAEMNNAMNELMQVAMAIQDIRQWLKRNPDVKDHRYPIYRYINDNCSWDCGYKTCCIAAMDGSDIAYLEDELLEPAVSKYETEDAE